MEIKKRIRKLIADRRSVIKTDEIKEASVKICEKVIALREFVDCAYVYAYIDFNNEVETKGIIEEAWRNGKKVAVPKITDNRMDFYEITSFEQLQKGYYGILEPQGCEMANAEDALMIVPGVAFDKKRHRVGYGGGFYDRYLEQHRKHVTVAVAFEFQIVDEAPCDVFDIIPQKLITEANIF